MTLVRGGADAMMDFMVKMVVTIFMEKPATTLIRGGAGISIWSKAATGNDRLYGDDGDDVIHGWPRHTISFAGVRVPTESTRALIVTMFMPMTAMTSSMHLEPGITMAAAEMTFLLR